MLYVKLIAILFSNWFVKELHICHLYNTALCSRTYIYIYIYIISPCAHVFVYVPVLETIMHANIYYVLADICIHMYTDTHTHTHNQSTKNRRGGAH